MPLAFEDSVSSRRGPARCFYSLLCQRSVGHEATAASEPAQREKVARDVTVSAPLCLDDVVRIYTKARGIEFADACKSEAKVRLMSVRCK